MDAHSSFELQQLELERQQELEPELQRKPTYYESKQDIFCLFSYPDHMYIVQSHCHRNADHSFISYRRFGNGRSATLESPTKLRALQSKPYANELSH